MTRRSFLSALTACLAALKLGRKVGAGPARSHVATWDGRRVYADDGPPISRYYFHDSYRVTGWTEDDSKP